MYLRHFRLRAKPFALNPDPAFLYASSQHATALTMLEYALESQASFCLLTGEIGSGKTTLVRGLIRMLGDRVTVGLVSNTHQRFTSIAPWALSAFGIKPTDSSEVARYDALNEFIINEYAQRRRSLLIIDEAQNLTLETLEDLRLLSNVNSEADVALQILLVGQPELRHKLGRPELHQFAQRVSVDYHLKPLSLEEVEGYIRHRLTVAEGSPELFEPRAIRMIHHLSGGTPRVINQLCDLALVYAYADGQERVDPMTVKKVVQDGCRGHGNALLAHNMRVQMKAAEAQGEPLPPSVKIERVQLPERA